MFDISRVLCNDNVLLTDNVFKSLLHTKTNKSNERLFMTWNLNVPKVLSIYDVLLVVIVI